MSRAINDLIELYSLEPHPEGGYFRETYRAQGKIPDEYLSGYEGERCRATAILFLIPEGNKSRLHRLKSDEIWHFYIGGPLILVQISPKGEVEEVMLGKDVMAGQKVQHVVPAGYWFGAYPCDGSKYSFVGCTVAPGFEFADFEMGNREELLTQFPHARDVIQKLTD